MLSNWFCFIYNLTLTVFRILFLSLAFDNLSTICLGEYLFLVEFPRDFFELPVSGCPWFVQDQQNFELLFYFTGSMPFYFSSPPGIPIILRLGCLMVSHISCILSSFLKFFSLYFYLSYFKSLISKSEILSSTWSILLLKLFLVFSISLTEDFIRQIFIWFLMSSISVILLFMTFTDFIYFKYLYSLSSHWVSLHSLI